MAYRYLRKIPKPLLDDLVSGRWIPIVGAGLSRNAIFPTGRTMPLWNELGSIVAEDLQGYDHISPIDSISSYEHEFGRPRLIEKLADALGIGVAQPGGVHEAFCHIPFDIVCTTNFDTLLEQQYERLSRSCTPLIGEDQLSVNVSNSLVTLLKLHGDLNHSDRLITTENDYDTFLQRYPIIATYLANLLITRTVVLIGYSLDDPDFRQVWQIVGERLGKARRHAYALCVGAQSTEVTRFERRGVKAINVSPNRNKYGEALRETFHELTRYWLETIVSRSKIVEEGPLQQLYLPDGATTRLCYFVLPLSAWSFYRYQVFPFIREMGLVPVTEGDVVTPPGSVLAKQEVLLRQASFVVIDASDEYSPADTRMAVARSKKNAVLVVLEEGAIVPFNMQDTAIIRRPELTAVEIPHFLSELERWLQGPLEQIELKLAQEARRLFDIGQYKAAVISAITYFETKLRERLDLSTDRRERIPSLRKMLEIAKRNDRLHRFEIQQVLNWLKIRNEVVHRDSPVSKDKSHEIINGVEEIIGSLRWDVER